MLGYVVNYCHEEINANPGSALACIESGWVWYQTTGQKIQQQDHVVRHSSRVEAQKRLPEPQTLRSGGCRECQTWGEK